jgi:hypothetical protein
MTVKKEAALAIRLGQEEKAVYVKMAKDHGISLTQLLLRGASFYGSFPPSFFAAMQETAKIMSLSVEDICVRMLIAEVASNAAWMEVFGKPPAGITRPFRWAKDGRLMTGDPLSQELTSEYKEIYERLKDSMIHAKKTGGELMLDAETAKPAMELLAAP